MAFTTKNIATSIVINLVVGFSFFILGCPSNSGIEETSWFRYASKYDQAMHKMTDSNGAMRDFYELKNWEQKFLDARQPTETEIISVLKSSDKKVQRIGLVAMSIQPIETDKIIDILVEYLQNQDPESRWYTLEALNKVTKFPESQKDSLGLKLLAIVKARKDNELSLRELSLLGKFPAKDTAQFLTEQLIKEGEDKHVRYNRFAAFHALKGMGSSYYDEAAKYVNEHSSDEVKNKLLELEDSWRIAHTSTPEDKK